MTQTIDIIYFPRWLPSAKISLLTVGDHINSIAMERYYQMFVEQMDLIYYEGYCQEMYSTPQNSDHWLSLPKHVTLSVDYESKKKKIYCSI